MNVLLIYPEFPDTFWSFKHALKFVRRKSILPPLGLLTVAAMLPSGIVTAMVGMLQALPGTKLYERLKGEGRLAGQTSGGNVDGTTNIIPTMSLDKLSEGDKHILQHIYSPKHYYQRLKTFLREYQQPQIKPRLDLTRLMAFWRSIYRLGILGKERCHYWRLLLWTLFRRPELLHLAVTLAIYGHHFRKVYELHVH